mgnify:CR=1 FL=1
MGAPAAVDSDRFSILHHGAVGGVTGSCHELRPSADDAILILPSGALVGKPAIQAAFAPSA